MLRWKIRYERAIPIKVEKWPSDLPDPARRIFDLIDHSRGIKLPLPLWELISPDHEHGELRVQRLFEHDNQLFVSIALKLPKTHRFENA